jgi:hypothetical protein
LLVEKQGFRLLRRMWVVRPDVNLKLSKLALTKNVSRQHPTNGILNNALRVGRPHFSH